MIKTMQIHILKEKKLIAKVKNKENLSMDQKDLKLQWIVVIRVFFEYSNSAILLIILLLKLYDFNE